MLVFINLKIIDYSLTVLTNQLLLFSNKTIVIKFLLLFIVFLFLNVKKSYEILSRILIITSNLSIIFSCFNNFILVGGNGLTKKKQQRRGKNNEALGPSWWEEA